MSWGYSSSHQHRAEGGGTFLRLQGHRAATQSLEYPRKGQSCLEQRLGSRKNLTLCRKHWVYSRCDTLQASKEIIHSSLLVGWHFHTGQCLLPVVLRNSLHCLPGEVQSPENKQQAEVKLWHHTCSTSSPIFYLPDFQPQFHHL